MARIPMTISEEVVEGDYGSSDGIVAECSRCGHRTCSAGTSGASVKRCGAKMREECPLGENNFYEADT